MSEQSRSDEPRTILVVDDELQIRRLLRIGLDAQAQVVVRVKAHLNFECLL